MTPQDEALGRQAAQRHQLLEMPDRFYCACGYGYDGPKRTVRGLRTHVLRSNSKDAGARARGENR